MTYETAIALLSEHASPLALLGGEDAGGQNVYVDELSRHLARLGYRVDIFTRRAEPHIPEVVGLDEGVRVVHLDAGPPAEIPKDDIWPLMPAFCGSLMRFMVRDGARYGALHGHFWMSGWAACALGRRLNVPVVQLFHALGKTKQRHQGAADTSPDERIAVELEVVREADRLVAQCPAEVAELVDDYDADPRKISLIPAAVNPRTFRPVPQAEARRRIGLAGDEPTIVYVGRILPRKDVRNVVRALPILAERHGVRARLLVVGGASADPSPATTPEIGELQRLAAALGVADRVIFTGKRQPSVLRYYYAAGDVAVTTPWYEPFGLTPLEAQACGRPVVGATVGGLPLTIEHGRTGLLVPPRDPAALAAALAELLASPARREQMGAAARARVEAEFTWARVAEQTAALYAGMARPRRELAVGGR